MATADPVPVRFAALGDSFTEGVGDAPAGAGERGWADLVAAGLAATYGRVDYANLAIRGKRLDSIVADQLPAALALKPAPNLVSLNGGGNDMLRPGADVDQLIRLTREAVRRCVGAGAHAVLLSGPDPSQRLPFGRLIRTRAARLTIELADLGTSPEVTFVDVFGDDEIRRPGYWAADRIHLNPHGHARVASLVLAALGLGNASHPVELPDPGAGILAEATFYGRHIGPWVVRRIRGRSSGDGRSGKHEDWVTLGYEDAPALGS